MSDVSRCEQINLQKYEVQDRQDAIYSCLSHLLDKTNEIHDAMKHERVSKAKFNWLHLEEFLNSIKNQVHYLHTTLVSYKFIMKRNEFIDSD